MSDMSRQRSILDVLFPTVRSELLRVLFAMPSKQRYVRELMRATGLTLSTVQDELCRLGAIGVVTSWSNGYRRFYTANRDHKLFAGLCRIVEVSERSALVSELTLPKQRRARRKKKLARLRPSRPPSWGLFRQKNRARR